MQIFDKTLFIRSCLDYCRKQYKLTITFLGVVCIILAIWGGSQITEEALPSTNVQLLKVPELTINQAPSHPTLTASHPTPIARQENATTNLPKTQVAALPAAPPPVQAQHKQINVKQGDTLSKIFYTAGISSAELNSILNSNPASKHLKNLRPGQTLSFTFDQHKILQKVMLPLSKQTTLSIQKTKTDYKFNLTEKPIETRISFGTNKIVNSLYKSAISAGLDDKLILQMTEIFGCDIDFSLGIRPGDTFKVLYKERYVGNEKIDNDRIIAAEFTNKGKTHHAVYYQDSNGKPHYYNPNGYGLQKAFLRSPVKFSRISSHFDLGRKHPILHIVRAHRGVDYAAPIGTPVKAVGDGKVIFVGKKSGYGNVVILQHGNKYTTLYGHLSKFINQLHVGDKVIQGQIIAYVGNTGLATAAHLHYEFRVNGVHQNPLTVSLPKTLEIPNLERKKFLHHAHKMLKLLEQHTNSHTRT
jgi:murein DD-endopeptidase MepM/ murein hydrolase activator NlpD